MIRRTAHWNQQEIDNINAGLTNILLHRKSLPTVKIQIQFKIKLFRQMKLEVLYIIAI
jgi:hypothetical protein